MQLSPFFLKSHHPPKALLPWLTCTQSITQKLQDMVGAQPRLTLIKQYWRQSNWWENTVLHLKTKVFHREILMYGKDKPCWYARTIIPDTTFNPNASFFNRLKQENLGQLIYDNPEICREQLDYYDITPQVMEYHWLKPILTVDVHLWGRLSTFKMAKAHGRFFLMEIFLPDLLKVIHEAT